MKGKIMNMKKYNFSLRLLWGMALCLISGLILLAAPAGKSLVQAADLPTIPILDQHNDADGASFCWEAVDGAVLYSVCYGEAYTVLEEIPAQEGQQYYSYYQEFDGDQYIVHLLAVDENDTIIAANTSVYLYNISANTSLEASIYENCIQLKYYSNQAIIQRREKGEDWKTIARTDDKAWYYDYDVKSSHTYEYRVIPMNENSVCKDYDSCATASCTFYPQIMILQAESQEDGSRLVRWQAEEGVSCYEVYDTYSSSTLAYITDTQYSDVTDATFRNYQVYAVDPSTHERLNTWAPDVISVRWYHTPTLSVSPAIGQINISFSNDICYGAVAELQKKTGDGEFVTLTTSDNSFGTSYVDSDVEEGVTYTYRLRMRNSDLTVSGTVQKTITFYEAPACTYNVMPGYINVSWTEIPGAASYQLYRRLVIKDSSAAAEESTITVTGTSYKDTDLNSNCDVGYYVTPLDEEGNALTYRSDQQYIRYLSSVAVTGVKSTTSGVEITASIPTDENHGDYYLYRYSGGSWSKIASKDVYTSENTGTITFTDSNVTAGTTYIYAIRHNCSYDDLGLFGTGKVIYYVEQKNAAAPTLTNGNGYVKVSWKETSTCSGYAIYKKVGSASYKKIATVSGQKTLYYIDKDVKNGYAYKYAVLPVGTASKEKYVSGTGALIYYLAPPAMSSVTRGSWGFSAKLVWTKNSYATGYRYQYGYVSGGKYTMYSQGSTSGASTLTDTVTTYFSGKCYARVCAIKTVNGVEYTSAWSSFKHE